MPIYNSISIVLTCLWLKNCFTNAFKSVAEVDRYMSSELSEVEKRFLAVQIDQTPKTNISEEEALRLEKNWTDQKIPELQRVVSSYQIEQLRLGNVDPVFAPCVELLTPLRERIDSVLDAACATGYYSEVIRYALPDIVYEGSDYSEPMVAAAQEAYPSDQFSVSDATAMVHRDASFDLVLASGVLEHIPRYRDACREFARVARSYVLLHRLVITGEKEVKYTKNGQYNIVTPRLYFPESLIIEIFEQEGFALNKTLGFGADNPSLRSFLFERMCM